ncbi:hypothetical protein HCEG_06881 [Histoplasma capsulatum var. duboisii H88]|uniref:DASH complex subunit DAD1 n=1 Tax=Ajellomyces capsulatus (strain H88) TaxID=544711 RepID=F0UNW2_AJEC8|nr:hypothetical protein HCEG_06881 [Histoplasma capsulatum var. duboisii H88]
MTSGQPPRPQSAANVSTHFEQQREGLSLEQVLQNINRLNRNLESVITVGNEFSSVEALWSQFETVMGAGNDGNENEQERDRQEQEHEHEHEHEQEREREGADVET